MLVQSLKLLLRFKSSFLYEEVSTSTMVSRGEMSYPVILPAGGYSMGDKQYLRGEGLGYAGYNIDVSNAFTIGFWLHSARPGVAVDPDTGNTVPLIMPVMDFVIDGSPDTSVIKIYESTSNGGNNIIVSLDNGSYIASSEQYSPLMWHYFWIVYDGTAVRIYVDGKEHTLQDEEGAVPPSIDGSLLSFYINHSIDGYGYNIAKNYGYITDIFLINESNNSEKDMQTVINKGIMYLVDDNYIGTQDYNICIYFNDPNNITVNSFIDDMSYAYIGRNDGIIMRGSPLMWETRLTFSHKAESYALGLDRLEKEKWSISDGFLELQGANLRL